MDDQRLPTYLVLWDIVDDDDEVVVVVDRNRLTRGFQRITFFSPISLKLIVCFFIQWQFWAVKCCFSQSVQIWMSQFYSSFHEQHKPLFPESLEKTSEMIVFKNNINGSHGLTWQKNAVLHWWKKRISSREFDHVRIEW